MKAEEKFDVIGNEYGIPVNMDIRRDVDIMCNLSQGIMEKGEAIGLEKGRKEIENKFIISMYEKEYSLEEIAGIMDKEINEIEKVIEG